MIKQEHKLKYLKSMADPELLFLMKYIMNHILNSDHLKKLKNQQCKIKAPTKELYYFKL